MAYDISGKSSSSSASVRASAATPAGTKNKDAPKIVFAIVVLGLGVYLLIAGNQSWFPFGVNVPKPAVATGNEKAMMQGAPVKPAEIPNLKAYEAIPEAKRPPISGS